MQHFIFASAESTALYNESNTASISSFNVPLSSNHATAVIPSRPSKGGLIFSSSLNKPLLHIYSFQKNQPLHNIVLPEKLSCLDVDQSGTWCAAGTPSGRVYLWEIASGSLFNSFTAHYRAVTVLRFHSDGQTFVTGSEDSVISIWSIPRIVDYESGTQVPTPLQSFTDHTLPITSIHIGVGTLTTSRIFSSSLDGTVKVWCIDAHTQSETPDPTFTLLATFSLPHPVGEIAVDPLERFLFAASAGQGGEIWHVKLFTEKAEKAPTRSLLNGNIGETLTPLPDKPIVAGSKVTSLALSITSNLLVGTQTGLIHIYDPASLQLLRTIQTTQSPNPSPVTYLRTIPKPIDLVGHAELNVYTRVGGQEEGIPIRPVMPFGRTRDLKGKGREVSLLLPTKPSACSVRYDPMDDYAYFSSQMSSSSANQPSESAEAKVERLENEVKNLREQLGKAKSINDAMWESMLQNAVAETRAGVLK